MIIGGNVMQSCMTSCDEILKPSKAFHFSALPGEIRQCVYRHYLGSWDAVVEYDRKTASFKLGGRPTYELLRTSHKINRECSHYVLNAYSGKLILRDAKIRRENGFGYVSSIDNMASLCPQWLLKKTEILSIEQGTSGMLMALPWYKMQSLQEIQLQGSSLPVAYYYPCGLSVSARANQEKDVFEGKYDTWCINGYNSWSQVPKPVAEGQVRVVTVRSGTVKGTTLMIKVQHKAECAEVLERYINSVLQPKAAVNETNNDKKQVALST